LPIEIGWDYLNQERGKHAFLRVRSILEMAVSNGVRDIIVAKTVWIPICVARGISRPMSCIIIVFKFPSGKDFPQIYI